MDAPAFPIGPPPAPAAHPTPADRSAWIDELARGPQRFRTAVANLTDAQIDAKYRNWSIRQIVHHVADSHLHAYARTKLALTEETPTIKPYDEGRWSELIDARTAGVGSSLDILGGVHERWVLLYRSMSDVDFERRFFHPEQNAHLVLSHALCYYAWHVRHHAGQIAWLRDRHGWE